MLDLGSRPCVSKGFGPTGLLPRSWLCPHFKHWAESQICGVDRAWGGDESGVVWKLDQADLVGNPHPRPPPSSLFALGHKT